MTKEIQNIFNKILDDVLLEVHRIIQSEVGINKKTGYNTLADSGLEVNTHGKVTDEGIDVEFPHYIVYVEWDRPKKYKSPPPFSVILDWVKKRGIQPTALNLKTVEQIAWMMRYVIWRDGWEKRIIAGLNRDFTGESPLDEYIDKMWEEKWADMLYDEITKEFEKYFD